MIYLYIPHAWMYRYIYIYIYMHWYTSRERNRKRDVSFGIQKPLTNYPYGGGGDVDHHWDTMIQADRCTALCMFPYIQHMSFTKKVMSSRQLCSQHAPFTNVMHCFFMSNPWVGPGSEGLGPRLQGLRSIHLNEWMNEEPCHREAAHGQSVSDVKATIRTPSSALFKWRWLGEHALYI